MKLFKRKNLMGLIYGIFVLLPFCAILSRVIYVQSNKNAYESYYGETINEFHDEQIDNLQDLIIGKTYTFTSSNSETINAAQTKRIYFTDLQFINEPLNTSWVNDMNNAEAFTTTYYGGIAYLIPIVNNISQPSLDLSVASTIFTFTLTNVLTPSNYTYNQLWDNFLSIRIYNNYSYLDNVFEYSVNKFIDDNNFGKMDFFQWFSTLFLDSNPVNNMYVHFVNWYMNYLLYVSLGYLIFSVLMWFVNFFRCLVEKSTELNL